MGFFSNVKAAGVGAGFITKVEADYAEFRTKNPSKEPYEFMVNSWQAYFEKADKMALAFSAKEIVKIYGCLPSPICVQMMAHQICRCLIPSFSETLFSQKWDKTMFFYREIGDFYISCDADRLNALFRTYNPRCYDAFLAETGKPPFDRERMSQNKERREGLGLT
jgi:hypothetical protein